MAAKRNQAEFWLFNILSFASIVIFTTMAVLAFITLLEYENDNDGIWKKFRADEESVIFGLVCLPLFVITGVTALYLLIIKFQKDYKKLFANKEEDEKLVTVEQPSQEWILAYEISRGSKKKPAGWKCPKGREYDQIRKLLF